MNDAVGEAGQAKAGFRYAAFISYRHGPPDAREAAWLHQALETFPVPAGIDSPNREGTRLGRVYRSEAEIGLAPDLGEDLRRCLAASRFLLVVCSPRAPASRWVCSEIEYFQSLGRGDQVLPVLIGGETPAIYPAPLLARRAGAPDSSPRNPVAADLRPQAGWTRGRLRQRALVQIVARLLGVEYDALYQRDRRRRRRRAFQLGAFLLVALCAVGFFATVALREGAQKEQARSHADTLATALRIGNLRERAHSLFPSDAASVAQVAPLLVEAREVVTKIETYRRQRTALEATALEPAALEPRASPPRFAAEEDARVWRALGGLIVDAEALGDPTTGLLTVLERRFMRTPTAGDDEARWQRTLAEVADETAAPIYHGLRLVPQWGLDPLGKDPASGLQEFAHLYSGSLPTRGKDGRLVLAEDAALVFVLIPGGTFWRGAARSGEHNVDPDAQPREGPVHEITLSPFLLSKYECTQAQWARLADGAAPSNFKAGTSGMVGLTGRNPVERITWTDCLAEPGWLRRYGLSLPTEAQWEFACRAPFTADGRRDDTYAPWWTGPDEDLLPQAELLFERESPVTAPVGSRQPNRFGLYDLLGNVAEWCLDTRGDDYYTELAQSPPEGRRDPPGAVASPGREILERAARGGSLIAVPSVARTARRSKYEQNRNPASLGARPTRALAR